MTDIRRHIPLLLSCIRQHIALPSDRAALLQQLRAALTELLPGSYGIATGRALYQGQQSAPLDIILYDRTIPAEQADEGLYQLRQTLLVAQLGQQFDPTGLAAAMDGIASAKMLRPQSQNAVGNTVSLKKLSPIGVVAFQQLTGVQPADQEAVSMVLDTALKQLPETLRADYLIAQGYELFYQSPLLEGSSFEATTINISREPPFTRQHRCYVCKQTFTRRHFFYTQLCVRCGDQNYKIRRRSVSLAGRIALVTGGRIKIGYATALHMLRAGATVIVTTRFPHDAARRYSSEPDFAQWRDQLHIYGLDLRHLLALEHFIAHLYSTFPALDILINNAAQTVKRPPAHYDQLYSGEQAPLSALSAAQQMLLTRFSPPLLSVEEHHAKRQPDLRPQNSWIQRIDEVDLTEMLEVQVINVTAPFLLISRLRELLRKSPFPQRYIVNVSAVEGQFAQTKAGTHPHTNMAKAALNMLTHTAAADLAQDNIFMNSVDPGFVSRQSPHEDLAGEDQVPPLDTLDAAARICDPIFTGICTGQAEYGNLYKNYTCTAW